MAVRATDNAFFDLALDPAPSIPAGHHHTDIEELCPTNVIELQNSYIALAAVTTGKIAQICDHILAVTLDIISVV